jgi:hypothetical protein
MMIPTGYLISCIKAIMEQNENPVCVRPNWPINL